MTSVSQRRVRLDEAPPRVTWDYELPHSSGTFNNNNNQNIATSNNNPTAQSSSNHRQPSTGSGSRGGGNSAKQNTLNYPPRRQQQHPRFPYERRGYVMGGDDDELSDDENVPSHSARTSLNQNGNHRNQTQQRQPAPPSAFFDFGNQLIFLVF